MVAFVTISAPPYLFKSFLSSCTQLIRFNSSTSKPFSIPSGVLQDSVLGALLFLADVLPISPPTTSCFSSPSGQDSGRRPQLPLSLQTHINCVIRSTYLQLHCINLPCCSLTPNSTTILIHSLFSGLPLKFLHKPQLVQSCNIYTTHLLSHYLQNTTHHLAPPYISDLLHINMPSQSLQCSSSDPLPTSPLLAFATNNTSGVINVISSNPYKLTLGS